MVTNLTLQSNPFDKIKGRYIVLLWLSPLIYSPLLGLFLNSVGSEWPWYWWDIFGYYTFHLVFFIGLLIIGSYAGLDWKSLFGKHAKVNEIVPALKLTVFIFLFSWAAAYALFLPLSYIEPEFVDWWYISTFEIIYSDGYSYPMIVNALSFISLVIIAPIIEEVAFRGMLLHRWSQKWGLMKAIVFSSLLFGIIHPDPIGAFVFSIGMCIIYLRTQSLFVSILCHAANNLLVWLIELGYKVVNGPSYTYTLEVFRDEWYLGLLSGVLVIIWITVFFRSPQGLREWKLPSV